MYPTIAELEKVMAYFGPRDGLDGMKRFGEMMRFNEYWFKFIQEEFDKLEDQATLETVGDELRRRGQIPKGGLLARFDLDNGA